MVIRWPSDDVTVNVESTVDRFAVDGEAAGKCVTVCEQIQIQKDISSGYATFGYQVGKVGSYLVCKVILVDRSWLITPRHAKLCELVGKWPVAILSGQWIRRTEPWSGRYILNCQFHDAGVITCTSLLISLSDKLHCNIVNDCPVF